MSAGTNQQFVTALLDCQRSLYAYLYKLTLDPAAAQEVLQEANLVLLAKQDEFEQIEHFGGWAARIAYFQLLAYRKRQSRERQRLSPELVEMLADEGQARVQPQDGRLAALARFAHRCRDLRTTRVNSTCQKTQCLWGVCIQTPIFQA